MSIKQKVGRLLGVVDLTKISSTPLFALGTRYAAGDTVYQYVKAGGTAPTQYLMYTILSTGILSATATGYVANQVVKIGVPQQSGWTASYYGWVAVSGLMTVSTTAAVAAGVKVYTTATAGKIDDVSTTQNQILGLTVLTDPAGAGDASCYAVSELYTN